MAESTTVFLISPQGNKVAELLILDQDRGWFTGKVVSQSFAAELKKALTWYDEVIQDQMLSYLDEATAAVERFGLRAKFPGGVTHQVYSLHVDSANEVSLRTSPVPPPARLAREAPQ